MLWWVGNGLLTPLKTPNQPCIIDLYGIRNNYAGFKIEKKILAGGGGGGGGPHFLKSARIVIFSPLMVLNRPEWTQMAPGHRNFSEFSEKSDKISKKSKKFQKNFKKFQSRKKVKNHDFLKILKILKISVLTIQNIFWGAQGAHCRTRSASNQKSVYYKRKKRKICGKRYNILYWFGWFWGRGG